MTTDRVTQAPLEVLENPTDAKIRVTGASIEVLGNPSDAKIRVTGRYDTIEGQRPRFMAVDLLEVLRTGEC